MRCDLLTCVAVQVLKEHPVVRLSHPTLKRHLAYFNHTAIQFLDKTAWFSFKESFKNRRRDIKGYFHSRSPNVLSS
jgi:hypothetical protein